MAAQKARDEAEAERVAKNLETAKQDYREAYKKLMSLISTAEEDPEKKEDEYFQIKEIFLKEELKTARVKLLVARKIYKEKQDLSEKTGLASA